MLQETTLDKVCVMTQEDSVRPQSSRLWHWRLYWATHYCQKHANAELSLWCQDSLPSESSCSFAPSPTSPSTLFRQTILPLCGLLDTPELQCHMLNEIPKECELGMLLKICLQPVLAGMEAWFTLVTHGVGEIWLRARPLKQRNYSFITVFHLLPWQWRESHS